MAFVFSCFFFFDNLTLTRNDHTAQLFKHKYTKYTAEAFKCTRPAARYASHLRVHHEFRPPSLLCGIRRHTEHDAAVHTDGRQLEPRSRAASHGLQRWREYPARFLRLAPAAITFGCSFAYRVVARNNGYLVFAMLAVVCGLEAGRRVMAWDTRRRRRRSGGYRADTTTKSSLSKGFSKGFGSLRRASSSTVVHSDGGGRHSDRIAI